MAKHKEEHTMAGFTIRSNQTKTSLTSWTTIHYSDDYNDHIWRRIAGDDGNDHIGCISTWGITGLVRNSYRIVDTGLHCRSRFEEAYAWCKDHDARKVRMCYNDIEYAIAVCRGAVHLRDGSRDMRDVYRMTEREYRRDFKEGVMGCAFPYAYKDSHGNCWLRCWFRENGEWYDECEAYMIEMATRFGIVFDYFENPANGDRIFTFGRMP